MSQLHHFHLQEHGHIMKMANLIKGDSTIQPFRSLHIQCFYSILDGPHSNPKGRIQVSWPMFVPLNLRLNEGVGPNIIKKWKGMSPEVILIPPH